MLAAISQRLIVKRFFGQRGGAAAAEFGIVIVFLTIVLIVAIEAGRLFHVYQVSDKAVRDAARYLAQQDIDCPAIGTNNGSMADARHLRIAEILILTGSVDHTKITGGTLANPIDSADLTLGYWHDGNDGISIEIDCLTKTSAAITDGEFKGAYGGFFFVPMVRVEADVPFDFMMDLWGFNGFSVDHRQVGIGNQNFSSLP